METRARSKVQFLHIPIIVTHEDYERYKELLIKLNLPYAELEQRLKRWCERYGM